MKYRRTCRFNALASLSVLATAIAAQPAIAQESEDQSGELKQSEIVVTGTVNKVRKIDSTNTINTFDQADIQQLAPISTADLLQNVPGIFAEGSTAGEASNNITVRGLPVTGGYRYAPQLFDGLPWFEEPEVQFMNNDVAVRSDLMTERVEVVKGGTGGILYSNGLGATVNYITRTGSQEFEGGAKFEWADYNFYRGDVYISGPINKNLTFALGGFYRIADGIRPTGFTSDNGGQLRGNLKYTSDDGETEIFAQAHVIRDRTTFFQNVPIQVPGFNQPGTADNPIRIRTSEVRPIGIDFGSGTVLSPFTRLQTLYDESGPRSVDLADGINPEFNIYTLKFKQGLGDGWELNAGLRHTTGESNFNAMFTGNDASFASTFLNARYQNDIVSRAHGAALSGNYADPILVGYFNVPANAAQVFPGISRDAFIQSYARAVGAVGVFLDDGSRVPGNAYATFLLPFITNSKADSTSFDFRLSKSIEFGGTHQFTLGGYVSAYNVDQSFQASLVQSTLETGNSRLFDIRGVDANGNIVGPNRTIDGAILPGFFGYQSDISANTKAFYLLDHWETLDSRLKIDAGVRYQTQSSNVVRRNRDAGPFALDLTPANITPGSNADTIGDNEIFGLSNRRVGDNKFDAWGFSLGANYSFSNDLAVYALASKSFRLPSLEDLNEFRVDENQIGDTVENIYQYEAGVRVFKPAFDAQLALFYNDFKPRQQVSIYRDFTSPTCAVPGGVPNINACPEVREFYGQGIRNKGFELEANVRPPFIPGLELGGTVVIQDPSIVGANFRTVREIRTPQGVVTGYEFLDVGQNGRRPRRLPNVLLNVRGSWDLKPLTGAPIKPYFKFTYFGDRFSESRDFDVTLYPSYYHLDAGAIVDFSDKLAFQVHVSNITNQLSFTEGDPLFWDLKGPDGTTNRGVARPLFGRTVRASINYRF